MSGGLAGHTALVTGASRGIGLAVAHVLALAGARVALLARSEAQLRERVSALSGDALAVPCDLMDSAARGRALEQVREAFGGAPDVIVANAAAFQLGTIESMEPELFAAIVEMNLSAPFALLHAFVGDMRSRGSGHVVTLGSIADRSVFPENGAYAASKHGLRALHEALRTELRGSGVRATLVSPGPTDTPLWDAIDPDSREGFTPRAMMLHADSVAAAVLYAVTQPADVNIDELRLSRS